MGGLSSQTINQTFQLDSLNKRIYDFTSKNTQSVSQSSTNINRMSASFGGDMINCNYSSFQNIDAGMVADVSMIPQTIIDNKNAIENDLSAAAKAALEKTTEFGNLQFGDQQTSNQKVALAVKNIVDETITLENVSTLVQESVQINEDELVVKGNCINSTYDRSQNITAKLSAEAITGALANAISQNDVLNKIQVDLEAEAKNTAKGLGDFFKQLFQGLTGPLMISSALLGLVCIALLVFMLSPAGQSATKNMSKAGAARVGRRF